MSHKTVYPTFSRSNYNLIVGILSDAGFFVNLNHMKSGKLFVAEVNGINDPMMAVWAHLDQFKGTIEVTRTENKLVVLVEVK
jgi:hypothetical protein